jgi:hypothetical protein
VVTRVCLILAALLLALPVAASGHPLDVNDTDHDGVINAQDNCSERYNPKQDDLDEDSQKVDSPPARSSPRPAHRPRRRPTRVATSATSTTRTTGSSTRSTTATGR